MWPVFICGGIFHGQLPVRASHHVNRAATSPASIEAMKNQPFAIRLRFALHGVAAAWRNELSFRTQCVAAVLVLLVLIWRQPAALWWALLLMNCGMVLAAELFNTALEAALDHLHPTRHPAIGLAKDCAAGAVLLLSLTGVGVFTAFVASAW
jgi:undecaprenol kinase